MNKIKTIELISNQRRLSMIRDFTEDSYELKLEEALSDIVLNGSEPLKLMLEFFSLLDTPKPLTAVAQAPYLVGDRNINIIKTTSALEDAIKRIQIKPFIGFDSEQKPTFKKGEKSHGVALIQLATQSDCYLIQIKQIKDISSLISLLENDNIIKIGTGLKGDKQELFNQFQLQFNASIDLEETLKKLSSKDGIGAKRAASMFLNQNLQKSKRISRSNWEIKELTNAQIKYASEDATVVYDTMSHILKQYPFIIKTMPEFFKKLFY